jgi:hypothetical protein
MTATFYRDAEGVPRPDILDADADRVAERLNEQGVTPERLRAAMAKIATAHRPEQWLAALAEDASEEAGFLIDAAKQMQAIEELTLGRQFAAAVLNKLTMRASSGRR